MTAPISDIRIPISKIGELQLKDIEASSGMALYDKYARVCTVVKEGRGIGDRSPYRMADMFGGKWQDYNNQYVIQAAGCPLDCRYCYVDNLAENTLWTATSIVSHFLAFRWQVITELHESLNVLHFMGGAPGVYCNAWRELREELDYQRCENVILFSNVIFVENWMHNVLPWTCMNLPNFIVEGCLKGTNRENFRRNTGTDLFSRATVEMQKYPVHDNFYLTLIGYDEKDLPTIHNWIDPKRIDLLNIVRYEATRAKMRKYPNAGYGRSRWEQLSLT